MWFTNPGRDALYAILSRILTPYVSNLDLTKFQAGLWAGQFSVNDLRLKKSALDKFRLPVDVIQGHLGHLTLNIPWANLTSKPAEIIIEDLYLLVVPEGHSNNVDIDEEEARAQASKQERLKNAEVLRQSSSTAIGEGEKNPGLFESLINKVVNNLQITVKNIHIRYEDNLSVPGHPFAVGITLAEFAAISTDDTWHAAFTPGGGVVHKLARLDSLGIYFNTDAVRFGTTGGRDTRRPQKNTNAGGKDAEDPMDEKVSLEAFRNLISHGGRPIPHHQFVLKPVTGEGRISIRRRGTSKTPKISADLLFDEIGFVLDNAQYRDVISMIDMYHFYLRKNQYRRLRIEAGLFQTQNNNRARALLQFAGTAILSEIMERNRRWSWAYFRGRRDDRRRYVQLFKFREASSAFAPEDVDAIGVLERKLSYEDIRFYRSIGQSQLRKERASQMEIEAQQSKNAPPPTQGWLSWAWGSGSSSTSSGLSGGGGGLTGPDGMTDAQRKELYEAIDYDEKDAVASSLATSRDVIGLQISAQLRTGSLALRSKGLTLPTTTGSAIAEGREVMSLVFDGFNADVIQRHNNIEATLTLDGMHVYDGTTPSTLYPDIIRMKGSMGSKSASIGQGADSPPFSPRSSRREGSVGDRSASSSDPFFYFKFEHEPLDDRADNAVTVKMRAMEIIYHRGFVEAIYKFLKPPESQLESVGALINAANQTLEGLRNQTRAGLEYALQTHKTIDIKVDMSAPVIIIPEDITSLRCQHLVLDAGHISMESDLANKDAIREIKTKRNQQYTDEDFRRLESLMYDKVLVSLHSAQLLVGEDLDQCLSALSSERSGSQMHLLERIDLDFLVQLSMVADALNLTRFKISGKLPTLAVNISNSKYKGLMRIIDISIPHFDDYEGREINDGDNAGIGTYRDRDVSGAVLSGGDFRLPSTLFGRSEGPEYVVEDDDGAQTDADTDEKFFEAQEHSTELAEIRQRTFEFSFDVERLQASVFKTDPDGSDRLLAESSLERFSLGFDLGRYDMHVNISLKSMSLKMLESSPGVNERSFLPLLASYPSGGTSPGGTSGDLVHIKYARVQQLSPEFQGTYEGINQSIDIGLSTFVFSASPEPVLALYDFIMNTFTPGHSDTNPSIPESEATQVTKVPRNQTVVTATPESPPLPNVSETIRLRLRLTSVELRLLDGHDRIATLALSAADVSLLLRSNTMRVAVQLGNLSLSDDSDLPTRSPAFKQILSIEGNDLADLTYETFNPGDKETFKGINSSVSLRSGALKIHFLEKPLHSVYHFLVKFARLKGLYDAATQVAVQRASEIQRMKFDVVVQSPIVIFPSNSIDSDDKIIMRLGQISARNDYQGDTSTIVASLSGISLTSETTLDGEVSELTIVDSVQINGDVIQNPGVVDDINNRKPNNQAKIRMTDVKISLTQRQYCGIVSLMQSLPRIFALDSIPGAAEETPSQTSTPATSLDPDPSNYPTDLTPELHPRTPVDGSSTAQWVTLDLIFSVKSVRLQLYNGEATRQVDFKETGISRFDLNDNTVRVKMQSDGAVEAEVALQSFTMTNTLPGPSRFREIIPAHKNRDVAQFMVLYTASGAGNSRASVIMVTIDSPKILFALDPMFALLAFLTSAFPSSSTVETAETTAEFPGSIERQGPPTDAVMAFRLDLHDVSITVLESDQQANSQAIQLSIKQVHMSQQGILALTVNQLGMSLTTMQSHDSVKVLEELEFTLSLDILRASLLDINLITAVVARAANLYSVRSQGPADPTRKRTSRAPSIPSDPRSPANVTGISRRPSIQKPQVYMSKEKLKAQFEGFRLILIGNLYQLPILHLSVEPFGLDVSDWSAELAASMSIAMSINYWNVLNSHWEPLIDPWTLSAQLRNSSRTNSGMVATLASKDRLDINITTTFIELALTTLSTWASDREHMLKNDRSGDAPYKIQNRTGCPILIWHDQDNAARKPPEHSIQLANEETIDWRFDDLKTTREHLSSSRNNIIGIQLQGRSWEPLRSLPVDREGEYVYVLRPRSEAVSDRLLCEIRVKDNVKIVMLRSTYLVQNFTLYPLELVLVDSNNKPAQPLQKIAPGHDYPIPVDSVTRNRFKLRPDGGFGYNWSHDSIRWEELIRMPAQTIVCRSKDSSEAPFRFQASSHYDPLDPTIRKYPKIVLQLRAPVELENLLPFDLNYRIFDKNTNQNWTSFLRKGGVMPVHSVQLDHLVLLNVELQDLGLKPSEFAIVNTDNPADFDVEKQLRLSDKDGRKLDLRLHYLYPESGGAMKVQIYSPFVLINHTGLPFSLRSGTSKVVANQTGNAIDLSKPAPFMFSHHQSRGNEFSFRLGDSQWSQVLSFEAPSAEAEIILETASQTQELYVGVSWELGHGKYKLSKVVTLAPRFILRNRLGKSLCFREHGAPLPQKSTLEPGERAPMQLMRPRNEKLLTVTYPGLNARWSAPINIHEVGTVHLRVFSPGEESQPPDLIKADVAIEGATIFVTFSLETGRWPFRVENDTDVSITFSQNDDTRHEDGSSGTRVPMYTVPPHSSVDYAWDFPSASNKKLRLYSNAEVRDVDILEIGNLIPFKFRTPRGSYTVSLDVRAEAGTQTLAISNYIEALSLYKPKHRRQNSSRAETSMGPEAFETVVAEDVIASLTVNLDLAGFGISLINKQMVELVYISLTAVSLEYADSSAAQTINVSLSTLQIDNQLHDALYPVVLQQTPLSSRVGTPTDLPAIQASIMALKDDSHGVLFVKYASVLLQAMTISVDEDFLFALFDFSKVKGSSWEEETLDALILHPDGIPDPTDVAEGQELYFEVLELQPIQLSLSFMRTERVNAEEKLVLQTPLAVVVNSLTMALGNVNEAQLQLNALGIKDARMSTPVLLDRVVFHYRQEVLRQLYRILGSADFLGNPVGLFTNVSSGIADVFYEPYKGAVMHGNKELGIGIAKGAASLVKKTVFGFSDSMTKVTSSIGKGLSSATLDSEYQRQRRLAQRQNRPKHAIYGVTAGAEALATSVQSGIEGVLMKPIEGAESGGAFGFFKGVGKGLVGAVAKPMVGVFDLASNVSEGIRNTTTVFDKPQRERVRIPRHIPHDGILTPYLARDALGQMWLKDLDGGRFRNDAYVAHLELPGRDHTVMLTTSRILSFWGSRLRLEWDVAFNRLQGVTIEDTGIRFSDKAGREYDKFIPVPKKSKMWFYKEIEKVVVLYNTKRRIER